MYRSIRLDQPNPKLCPGWPLRWLYARSKRKAFCPEVRKSTARASLSPEARYTGLPSVGNGFVTLSRAKMTGSGELAMLAALNVCRSGGVRMGGLDLSEQFGSSTVCKSITQPTAAALRVESTHLTLSGQE